MQIVFNDQRVRSETVQGLKDFNPRSLSTPAKRGEQLVFMKPAIKKAFDLMGDEKVELSAEKDALKNEIGSYNEKWLEESIANLLKQMNDERRAKLIMSRMKKQMKNVKQMAYISYNILWENEFDNIVSKRDKLQDVNNNQLKLEVDDG